MAQGFFDNGEDPYLTLCELIESSSAAGIESAPEEAKAKKMQACFYALSIDSSDEEKQDVHERLLVSSTNPEAHFRVRGFFTLAVSLFSQYCPQSDFNAGIEAQFSGMALG